MRSLPMCRPPMRPWRMPWPPRFVSEGTAGEETGIAGAVTEGSEAASAVVRPVQRAMLEHLSAAEKKRFVPRRLVWSLVVRVEPVWRRASGM